MTGASGPTQKPMDSLLFHRMWTSRTWRRSMVRRRKSFGCAAAISQLTQSNDDYVITLKRLPRSSRMKQLRVGRFTESVVSGKRRRPRRPPFPWRSPHQVVSPSSPSGYSSNNLLLGYKIIGQDSSDHHRFAVKTCRRKGSLSRGFHCRRLQQRMA